MTPLSLPLKNGYYLTGLIFICISLIVFLIPAFSQSIADDSFGIFTINFVLAGIYLFVGIVGRKRKAGALRIHLVFLFLILALISAYSLNREMSVFQQSTTWMCVVLTTCCINYIGFAFFQKMPVVAKHIMCFMLGIATMLFLYLGIYLLPLYGISIAAFFVLGLSLHTFVPLLFLIYTIFLLRVAVPRFRQGLVSFFAGVIVVVGVAAYFVITWNNVVTTINSEYRKEQMRGDEALPAWVRVSQRMEPGAITEKVLKAGLTYALPNNEWSFTSLPTRNFGEEQKHDPLVMLSAMTTSRVQLSPEEKINVLRSLYDSRHQAEERLWNGHNLVTSHVSTRLRLWPDYRMAYTEKIVTVTNENTEGWGRSEEAIYTFHLPEGGVATSLSLWINGKEEKAILTSKEKATTAYRTIVGVESRDPSVVHWQEGNRVSVRVFPVLPHESRMFKIGITSPVAVLTGDLVYDNIWFDGPSVSHAKEDIVAELPGAENIITPSSFSHSDELYEKEGSYDAGWSISCKVAPIVKDSFSFDDNVYSVEDYAPVRSPAMLTDVYLDVNASWTERELDAVWAMVKGKHVFAHGRDKMMMLDEQNKDEIFSSLLRNRFSLFPFHKIEIPGQALVISKSAAMSPNLDELQGSLFSQSIQAAANPAIRYRLYNLSPQVSPYLASLMERRYFHYEKGNLESLQSLLTTSTFAHTEENDEEVIIHNAGIKLVRRPGALERSAAPDHLMRLFTYNHIMQQLGAHPLEADVIAEPLTELARQSYIVTPLSSLVVLESQRDYDRFDIRDKGNSLKNASMKSTGAVPEPHEWALIILAITVLLYFKFPHLFKKVLWKA